MWVNTHRVCMSPMFPYTADVVMINLQPGYLLVLFNFEYFYHYTHSKILFLCQVHLVVEWIWRTICRLPAQMWSLVWPSFSRVLATCVRGFSYNPANIIRTLYQILHSRRGIVCSNANHFPYPPKQMFTVCV